MITDEIRRALFARQDLAYRDFQGALIPTVEPQKMIGVRTPELKILAKAYKNDPKIATFLSDLPHEYFEENQLHAFLISLEKDFAKCVEEVDRFLPYIDNWATCDQLSPGVFVKHKQALLPFIDHWIDSGKTYAVRFGIKMLLTHFLDGDFTPAHLDRVAKIESDEYYVNMMIAWYFATALAKQYEATLPILKNHRLDVWTHNKAIQKAIESRRITDEQKEFLRSLKRG
ncbi:MAG: DNA alkylation repair protein [Clostridia bacterium]|nr:DNA alkylation repair protein [Clostridia bacterium]